MAGQSRSWKRLTAYGFGGGEPRVAGLVTKPLRVAALVTKPLPLPLPLLTKSVCVQHASPALRASHGPRSSTASTGASTSTATTASTGRAHASATGSSSWWGTAWGKDKGHGTCSAYLVRARTMVTVRLLSLLPAGFACVMACFMTWFI